VRTDRGEVSDAGERTGTQRPRCPRSRKLPGDAKDHLTSASSANTSTAAKRRRRSRPAAVMVTASAACFALRTPKKLQVLRPRLAAASRLSVPGCLARRRAGVRNRRQSAPPRALMSVGTRLVELSGRILASEPHHVDDAERDAAPSPRIHEIPHRRAPRQ
jgi:hypothetical protein